MQAADRTVGQVGAVFRYPVKSLVGEPLDAVSVDRRGLTGDRTWAVRDADGRLGSGKSSRRFRRMPGLLELQATLDDDPAPWVVLPDGRRWRAGDPDLDAEVSDRVGRPVTLAAEAEVAHFDEGAVHLVTTSSLLALAERHGREVDPRRLRPNLVLDTGAVPGWVEDGWPGRTLRIGAEVVLHVRAPMPRCVMVGMAQRDVPADDGLLAAIADAHDLDLGVVADVVRPGRLAVGDAAVLLGDQR